MGYTHYWYRKAVIEQGVYSAIVADFKQMLPRLAEMGVKLGDGWGRGEAVVNDEEVSFNGLVNCGHPENASLVIPWPSSKAGGIGTAATAVAGSWFEGSVIDARCCDGDCSYETFDFPRETTYPDWASPEKDGLYFNFCKTAFRPYDLAVIVFLIIAKHHLKDEFRVASDGSDNHWFDGKLLCQMELGYGQDFQF